MLRVNVLVEFVFNTLPCRLPHHCEFRPVRRALVQSIHHALLISGGIVGLVSQAGFRGFFTDAVHPIADPSSLTWWQWVGNLTLTETWRYHLFGDHQSFFVGHAWTLCFEEQFYAVCGVLLLLTPRRFFTGVLVITLASAAAKVLCRYAHVSITGFFFEGNWLVFTTGVLVYYLRNYALRNGTGLVLGILSAGIAGALGLHLSRFYVAGFSFGIILVALQRYDSLIAGAAIFRPLAFCGQICYSLYLVHWPVAKAISHGLWFAGIRGVWPTVLVVVPLALCGSILAGWLFHLSVERRFLNPPQKATVSKDICVPLGASSSGTRPVTEQSAVESKPLIQLPVLCFDAPSIVAPYIDPLGDRLAAPRHRGHCL